MSRKKETVLVTGSSSGIGIDIARGFLEKGFNVVLNARNEKKLSEAARVLGQDNPIAWVAGDIGNKETGEKMVRAAVDRFGGVNVLVNNAGGISEYKHFVDLDVESWEQAFSLNVTAPFALSKSSWSYFVAQEGGKIINISSAAVRYGGSARGLHYVSAKAALEAMTVALAKEGASKNILVNAIRCGLIETDMHRRIEGYNEERYKKRVEMVPLGRPGRSEEVAALVAHLASEDGAFITGQVLTIAGGD